MEKEEEKKPIAPEAGMGATIMLFSDRLACTVIKVSRNGTKVSVRRDRATRLDSNGMSDSQVYKYERDPQGVIYEFSLRGNGLWTELGQSVGPGAVWLSLGSRFEYYDYSFI